MATPLQRMMFGDDTYLASTKHIVDLAKLGIQIRDVYSKYDILFTKFYNYEHIMLHRKNKIYNKEIKENVKKATIAQMSSCNLEALQYHNIVVEHCDSVIADAEKYLAETETIAKLGIDKAKLDKNAAILATAHCELDKLVSFRATNVEAYIEIYKLVIDKIAFNLVGIVE